MPVKLVKTEGPYQICEMRHGTLLVHHKDSGAIPYGAIVIKEVATLTEATSFIFQDSLNLSGIKREQRQ
jgi:hypothetical protein